MRRWGANRGAQVAILIFCGILLAYRSFTSKDAKVKISSSCACEFEGKVFDFCYWLPEDFSIRGRRFDCSFASVLKKLDLLPLNTSKFINLSREPLPPPMFVTAFSSDHLEEGRSMIAHVRKYWPKQKIVFYDLGLYKAEVAAMKSLCNVEYRKFKFSEYPFYVSKLYEFRWKPILIAEALTEFGAIWYMDTSVKFRKGDLSHVYELVTCKRKSGVPAVPDIPSVEERDRREERMKHENGWDKENWKQNIRSCDKSAYLLHGFTGHGIFAATEPGVYDYFPTNFTEIKKLKAKMYEAGFAFVVRTREIAENILKWYVLCALEKDCMSPAKVTLDMRCDFTEEKYSVFAGCHRYDQSVVNLLLANAFNYDRHYYVSEIVDFFNVVRSEGLTTEDSQLWCNGTGAAEST